MGGLGGFDGKYFGRIKSFVELRLCFIWGLYMVGMIDVRTT